MMTVSRILAPLAAMACIATATPAAAQFFFKSHDMTGPPVTGEEIGTRPLTGATDAETRANLVWNLRSALNVAALQCQFEPTLMTVENYNVVLANHKDELTRSYAALAKYFNRTAGNVKKGQTAFDQFGTRTYSSFTTVGAQYGFCQTAADVAAQAAFAPRGELYKVAIAQMNTLRNALLAPWGEERFRRPIKIDDRRSLPRLDDACWDRSGRWVTRKCGAYQATLHY